MTDKSEKETIERKHNWSKGHSVKTVTTTTPSKGSSTKRDSETGQYVTQDKPKKDKPKKDLPQQTKPDRKNFHIPPDKPKDSNRD